MHTMLLSLGLATVAMVLAVTAYVLSKRTAKDDSMEISEQGY